MSSLVHKLCSKYKNKIIIQTALPLPKLLQKSTCSSLTLVYTENKVKEISQLGQHSCWWWLNWKHVLPTHTKQWWMTTMTDRPLPRQMKAGISVKLFKIYTFLTT